MFRLTGRTHLLRDVYLHSPKCVCWLVFCLFVHFFVFAYEYVVLYMSIACIPRQLLFLSSSSFFKLLIQFALILFFQIRKEERGRCSRSS